MAKYQEEKPFKNPAYITILKVFIITLYLNDIVLKFKKHFHIFFWFFSLFIQIYKVLSYFFLIFFLSLYNYEK